MERPKPYVGVTGVVDRYQQGVIVDLAMAAGLMSSNHFMMLGVNADTKTQLYSQENEFGPSWYPVGGDISPVAANEDSGLTKVYAHCTFEPEYLHTGLEVVHRRTFHYLKGIQLNSLPWLDLDYDTFFYIFRSYHPNLDIVLQAQGEILDAPPASTAYRLGGLAVDYVLLDGIQGKAPGGEVAQLRPIIDAIYQAQLPVGVIVATDLSTASLESLFAPLVTEFPDLSCSANPTLGQGPSDKTGLDLEQVHAYIQAWKSIVQHRQA